MSAGGLLSQMVLGGAGNAAQGIGDKLRKDAELKRQQLLDSGRFNQEVEITGIQHNNAMVRQDDQQAHDEKMAGLNHDNEMKRQKGLLSIKASTSSRNELPAWQSQRISTLEKELSHINGIESNLIKAMGGTDELGNPSTLSPQQTQEWESLKRRKASLMGELESLTRNPNAPQQKQRPATLDENLLAQMLKQVPEGQERTFLAEFTSSGRFDDETINRVKSLLESRGTDKADVTASEDKPVPMLSPNEQPQGGMLAQDPATIIAKKEEREEIRANEVAEKRKVSRDKLNRFHEFNAKYRRSPDQFDRAKSEFISSLQKGELPARPVVDEMAIFYEELPDDLREQVDQLRAYYQRQN
ncbi:hypothetical protein [Hahella ganghwensis]|uniref:hypothetical protein n=1 Tax=Hahella ganghwensis TaxID=286420 RepID=UPI0003704314|nr:hypothetical protein [Hahella ganghwensis]